MKINVMQVIYMIVAPVCAALMLSRCSYMRVPEGYVVPGWEGAMDIVLSDEEIIVEGDPISASPSAAVYAAKDIVYYPTGKDFTFGEGTAADAHDQAEADAHTVIHITQPGLYTVSGKISAGQIAVDLGEEAVNDPAAVVTLVLHNADISCSVAPAIIFYNVYECCDSDSPTKDVDTSGAGANVILSDGTENFVNGSYVARIYQPDTVKLNAAGTEVEDAKKLHKYDAALYSRMSMNVSGDREKTGTLRIEAENEGLDSEMHLTIGSGSVEIISGNDGINTNEDGISVTTVNDGTLKITVNGDSGEGDGIDSNGWLVINGGTVMAEACSTSADAGIDSDMGIHINGGTVIATGHMLDRIEAGGQNYVVFNFSGTQKGGQRYTLKNSAGNVVAEYTPANDFSVLVFSAPELAAGDYTFWKGETKLAGSVGGMMGGPGMGGGFHLQGTGGPVAPEMLEGVDLSELPKIPAEGPGGHHEMAPPEGMERPQRNEDGTVTLPDGTTVDPSEMMPPDGQEGFRPDGFGAGRFDAERSDVFAVKNGGSMFSNVAVKTE